MQYEVTICYSDPIIRAAARRFFLRYARNDAITGMVLILMAVAAWLAFDLDWRLPISLLLLALVVLTLVIATARRYTRRSIANFRLMKDPTATWRFSPEFIGTKSELGSSEFRWNLVKGIWRYPDMWILLFGPSGYSVLPTANLDEEVKAFIAAHVQTHGGKVN